MKNTRIQRTAPVAALGLVAALALAGCGADAAESSQSPTPTMSDSMAAQPAGAQATQGDYELTGFWVKESSLDMSAGFGVIANTGDVDDELVGASAPGVPVIELHEVRDDVMQQVESFTVPAGGSLELSPGGNHLMFLGLTEPLVVGNQIDVTLEFSSGATATITAPIEPFSEDDGHDHAR